MRNFIIKPILTDNDQYLNALTTQAHIDDDYYVRDLFPKDVSLAGNSSVPTSAATLVSYPIANEVTNAIQFSEGSSNEIQFNTRSRLYWEKGNVEITLYYTGTVSSTNNIRWTLEGRTYALDDLLSEAAALTVIETTPGPSTALAVKKFTFSSYLPFSRESEIMTFRLVRFSGVASDTYTGHALVVAIKLRLIPALNQTGTKL